MPTKAELYAQMADKVATQLTGSWQEWAGFLTTASRLYKYPFHEQLMIYAQRPDATACAEYDLWNEKMGRYVRRGSKGIALVDDSGDRPRLRYVFDISDTGTREHSRTPWLWQLEERHLDPVQAMLERTYDVSGDDLAGQLTEVAGKLAEEYWTEHQQDFFYIVDGSFLEEYDEYNIGVQFKAAATVSITYALMSRCGLEPERYFDHEDFMAIFDFNTPSTIGALGTAVSQINQQVLRQIGVTVRNAEREANQERSKQDEQSHELYPERRLSDSQPEAEPAAVETPGQVRKDEENLSEGAPSHPLQPDVAEREAVPAPHRDRRDRPEQTGTDDAPAGEGSGSHRGTESQRSHEVGGPDEHLQSPGRGDPDGGAYQQLTLNLFLSEAEQIQSIDEAENVAHTSSAFSFAQNDIDHVLRLGGNTDRQRERVVAAFEKQKTTAEIAEILKTLYHGGNGLGSVSAWYAEDGIHLSHGKSVRYDRSAQVISWESAAERIGELLESGQFASNVELAEAAGYERSLLAEKLWYLYHDFSEEAREAGYLSCLSEIRGNGFPEETRRLTEQLNDPAFRQTLKEEYAAFWTAYQQDRDLLRFHYHRPREIWENLKDLDLPRRTFSSDLSQVPTVQHFITEDEIDTAMTGGSSFAGGKGRIYAFFMENHTDKEKVRFLKDEYGIGGRSHALSGATHSGEDHDGKGLHYKKQDCPDVHLNWEKVSKRITSLVQKGRYLTEQEQAQYDKIQAEKDLAEEDAIQAQQPEIEEETPKPTLREQFEQYKPVVTAAISEDVAYRNACGHSDRENAVIEGNAAVRRAVLGSKDMELIRLYSDVPEFRQRLHREVIDETYPKLHELLRPLSQEDIDRALCVWNGNIESKHAVVRYMKDHAREKDTAAWLAQEYGGSNSPFVVRAGSPEETQLPWPKVQRRLAQLIQEDRFYTEEEQDRFDNIDPIAIREALEERGIVNGQVADSEKLDNDPFIQQVVSDVEQIAAAETEQPSEVSISDEEYDAVRRPTPQRTSYDPAAPVYAVGDTVYIEDDAYQITELREDTVQLLPTGMVYPIYRAERKEQFEQLLRADRRNAYYTEFLPIDPDKADQDLRDVLAHGLMDEADKQQLSTLLQSGRSNSEIAYWLSRAYSGEIETLNLETGDIADYRTTAQGIELEVMDAEEKRLAMLYFRWDEVAPLLRGMYARQQDGFGQEQPQPATESPTFHSETMAVYPGDKNNLPYDVVVERLHIEEPEPPAPVTEPEKTFEEVLDEHPVSIQVNGQWQTFPNAKAAEEASYEEYKANLRRNAKNFRITDEHLGEGGPKAKFQANVNAIRLLKELEAAGQQASPEQQEVLSRYVGWGGLSDAFDPEKPVWALEYAQLKELLTPEEYAAARSSTLNAHYTSPTVIRAIYEAVDRMGFETGNILEPSCGVGNFFGMLPEEMRNSRLYGVELDSISGRIAKQLYPKADITVAGFETTDRRDFYDLAIGNVPFGQYQVRDKAYDKLNFSIHNYFFAKALDQVRPGGVVAFVTSRYTMDAKDSTVRRYLAQRAELLGAIRLPNDAFKKNAGAEVVSDIIFLQKRDRPLDIAPEWTQTGQTQDGFAINRYFIDHPEMVLGRQEPESTAHGMDYTVNPIEGLELADQLHDAVKYIRGTYQEAELPELGEGEAIDTSIPADPNVKNYSYTVVDGTVYFRENSRMVRPDLNTTAEARVKGLVGLRECVQQLIDLQMDAATPDSAIQDKQAELNRLYDSFSAKYGLINDRANRLAFADDSSYYLLCALEVIDEDGKLERKADMFFKRTIKPHKPVTEVDTADEALAVSMGEKAAIDMEYMMELSGKSEEELFADLKGVIFLNPLYEYGNSYEPKYLMADEYLSGNVREKLATAKRSAALYPEDYTVNVQALEKVQPKDLTASEISVRLGATWIPPEIFQQFMFEFLDTPRYAQWNIKVHYSQFTGEWNIEGKSYDRSNVKAYSTYGTSRINAYKIIEETLNLKDVRIFDYIEDEEGRKKAVLNKKETAIAQAKQELIKQGFQDWIWADPARREKLTKMYNEKFNSIRPREYDGSHIVFNGMNPEIELREHQKNAVAHILYGGNTLLAHAVGAGKTFEMVAAAMESKRLGLCNKSLFVVPNHLTEQWAAEFLQLYPAANILVATKRDFETKNRKKFCGRIATGDYDAVIIGHSQFEKIPMSIERQRAILEQQLEELTDGIMDLKRNRGENFSIKQLEKSKKSVKQKLEKLNDQSRKDDVVTFEELGVDRLFIDESHYYKNLYLYTKMRNVGGIAQTEAQKSSDLFMKCRYLDELTGGRGTVFATGTPISNSMVELYTIQRYLQYNTLVKNNLQHFDSWASTFGETVTAVELTPEGTGYRAKTRFAKFYNLPELMAMFKEVADIKTADMLELPVPEAHFHNVAVKPSEMQKEMVASLAERAEKVRGGGVDSSVDNMLKITNDGRKLALDQRMLNDMLPDFEGSKINACVDNIYRIWEETADKKSAQLVFCDLSTPKNDGTFSVYNDIRKKLIERGVPESEVRFIHEADTDVKKKELFQKTRKGEVRVLLGSTQKMGAGTNVQDRLIALHDVDCPWRPSDLEQRSGRIIRQGNSNPDVDIYRYVTEQTFDAYLYQLVEGKQKFASQIMTSKSPVRSAEDIDETALSYAEIKMLATGNPYIKEKMDLDIQVQKLKLLKSNFLSEKYALEDKIIKYYPQRITALENRIEGLKQDVETAKQHPKPTDDRFVGMEVKGVFYSEKADAGKAIIEACKQMNSPDPIPLGKYRGFETELLFNTAERNYEVRLKGATSRNVPLGDDAHGNIIRLDNGIERFAESLSLAENDLENTKNQLETAKKEVQKPFIQEEELKTKLARLDELNILLNMDKRENEIVGGEPDEGEVPNTRKEKTYER